MSVQVPSGSSPQTIMISTSITAAALNALIASADAGSVFILENGVHEFDAPLVINRSDITLRGESESGTQLRFSLAPGSEATDIQVTAGAKTYVSTASVAIAAGATSVTVGDASNLHAGDTIYMYQPNTAEYLAANGWTNVSIADAAGHPFREYIVVIDHIVGNQVFLKSPVPFAMDATETRVFAIDMLHNVQLSDFTVSNNLPAANPYNFVNPLPAYDSLSAIQFTGTSGSGLSHVSVLNAASNGISILSSINFSGHDLLVDGAVNKGGDGNGYGILLSESFNNTFTGLDLMNGRHAFILSAWNAETGNTVQINNTNRDINFHGSPDRGNTVSVNHAVMQYDPAQNTSGFNDVWSMVSHGGKNHPYTNIYSTNQVQFHFAVGASAADDIRGTSANDYLNGGGGADKINGGAGDDFIVGGLKRDVLTGGAGHDTFLFKMGDDLDKIVDFIFGAGGDTIIFAGNSALQSMANLKFTQNGADLYIKYGVNSTVILQNHTVADVNASNFEFDSSGVQSLPAWNGDFIL
jgi:Ca2+-binding RTX toxin-like protein